jgi:endo-1,4-beta-xylanase
MKNLRVVSMFMIVLLAGLAALSAEQKGDSPIFVDTKIGTVPDHRAVASHPAVEAFFNSPDPFIQQTVIPNIEKHRKSDFTLRFADAKGKTLSGLKLTGQLERHQFLFGACPGESRADADPRWIAAWSKLFNYGVGQNAMKWSNVERAQGVRDFARIDRILDMAEKHGIALEYHFLTGYHPAWLKDLPDAEKAEHQKAFAREVVKRYKDKMAFFQVFNEDWQTHIPRAKVYFDQTEFVAELVKEFPGVKFGISDCWTMDDTTPIPDPEAVKKRYPGVSYLALHAHKPRRKWISPQEMYRNFDKYLASGLKLHITEFGIEAGAIEGDYRKGDWTDENIAEYFVQVRTVAFSHPAVEAFNQWGMGPEKNRWTGNLLVCDDYSPKPAYEALDSLINHRLTTAIHGVSDADGQYRFRGFHGQYEITVTNKSGAKATAAFAVDPQETQCNFIVENADSPAMTIKAAQ